MSSTANRRYAIVKEDYKLVYPPTLEDSIDKYGVTTYGEILDCGVKNS